jgi:hypothetical protein
MQTGLVQPIPAPSASRWQTADVVEHSNLSAPPKSFSQGVPVQKPLDPGTVMQETRRGIFALDANDTLFGEDLAGRVASPHPQDPARAPFPRCATQSASTSPFVGFLPVFLKASRPSGSDLIAR